LPAHRDMDRLRAFGPRREGDSSRFLERIKRPSTDPIARDVGDTESGVAMFKLLNGDTRHGVGDPTHLAVTGGEIGMQGPRPAEGGGRGGRAANGGGGESPPLLFPSGGNREVRRVIGLLLVQP